MRKLTREEFILKARQLHGWKYDYSKVEYVNTRTKVCIICPIHGEFWQAPSKHLSGRGCHQCIIEENKSKPKCRNKRLTTDIFVQRARLIHVGKYDYSKAKYVNRATKVCIVCPAHGEFWQAPCNHLSGNGCPICAKESTKERISSNTQDFIAKSHNKHGDKYDYSKVEYKGSDKKVCIICPDHGEFWQTPESHLQGKGCPICAHKKTSQRKTKDHSLVLSQFIKKHGLIFDYSKMEYKGMMTKITIICPNGHEFSMTPKHHLKGGGCPYCAGFDRTTEQFIEESRGVHGDKYIYTATKYTKATDKSLYRMS